MELKKSKSANLESKKTSFRLLGLVMVCAIVGMAFEYTDYTAADANPIVQDNSMEADLIFEPMEEEDDFQVVPDTSNRRRQRNA